MTERQFSIVDAVLLVFVINYWLSQEYLFAFILYVVGALVTCIIEAAAADLCGDSED